jgi:hypothetical protein
VEPLEQRCQPSVTYSSYLGGDTSDEVTSVATDVLGNIYVAGRAGSNSFPGIPGPRPAQANGFVAKLGPAGNLLWAGYVDTDLDGVRAIAVDRSGHVYVTGTTEQATNFATSGAAQTNYGGNGDAFVIKMNTSDGAIDYATYLGGEQLDVARGIAVDRSGDAFVTGYTISAQFPKTNPLPGQGALHVNSGQDAFVTEINPSGSQFLFSTYLGGSQNGPGQNGATKSQGNAITLDVFGNIYLTGFTEAADFPTANAFQPVKGAGMDVFVTEIRADETGLAYSTFLGGPSDDLNIGNAIAVDRLGNILIAGDTDGAHFPLKNAFQGKLNGTGLPANDDAFVSKINPRLVGAAQLVYSTYLGGSAIDFAQAIAVDTAGNAYVTGQTNSDTLVGHFPLVNAFQRNFPAGAFLTELAPGGQALLSSYYGGGGETGEGLAVDGFGNVVFVGHTQSAHLPTTANAYLRTFPGGSDSGFVALLGGANKSFSGTDTDGDQYTVQLSGPGAVSVAVDDSTGNGRGPIESIALEGTSPASSVLIVRVTRKVGDGFVDVGSITGSGLLQIAAGTANLVGSGISLSGGLGSLYVHDVRNGAGVLAADAPAQLTGISAHDIGDGTTINVGGSLSVLTAARIGAATIIAPRLTTLTVTGDRSLGLSGDLAAHLILTGTGTALGTATIAGRVSGADIEVRAGSVGTFVTGAFLNSTLFVGQGGKLTSGARLVVFAVTGLAGSTAPAFVNSNVAASVVGTVGLASVRTDNGGTKFGVEGHQAIGKVVVTNPHFVYNPRQKTPQGVGDFQVSLV